MMGRAQTPETRAKISAAHRGLTHSVETRAKMSAAHRGRPGRPQTAETRAKLSAAHLGKTLSAEHRMKLSTAHAGKPQPKLRGRTLSPETRAKMSAARTKPWSQKSSESRHQWVRDNFEDPGGCERCGRTDGRLEWASIGHTYTQNRADWLRLCNGCHQRMDRGRS
jgi:NUMOD3 motif